MAPSVSRLGTKSSPWIFAAILACFTLLVHRLSITSVTHRLAHVKPILARSIDGDIAAHITNVSEHHLDRRADYSCGAGRPCTNGACCGSSGFCGYGSTYCGAGCVSNCDATAECGQFAVPAGKQCPLNTCCSQYGFCGTTTDFCTNNCQSNCVEHPTPIGSNGDVLSRVIGYYESWAARSGCHRVAPGDLPLDALTHINYAFAYIDPSSFQIVTMDQNTPVSSFQQVADLKKYKSSLQIFVSIGGWTFSDNGTATQPVFGNIASSEANRQKFANIALAFLNQYGLDGIDIDWEYPGAPDRGGQTRDVANFVSLLATLRQTFSASPRQLGITFTAPSSYWYLKWFDLPNLIKYADWINLMSYDLHGVWDRNNPIGSIVQAHTNLTEIKLAAELFWRVGIPSSKLALGVGFYGRSFQLANPGCTIPGCPFSGDAAPGPCSDSSGILTYYEVQALLAQNPSQAVHDQTAAVKYAVFGNTWVSWDDAETFKAKVAWANSVGMSGSLIWASDYDDDKYTAHSGFLGRSISHSNLDVKAFSPNAASVAQNLRGQNGQNCMIVKDCTVTDNPQSSACPSGFAKLGWERGDCGKNYGRSICCPTATAPKSCIWRGGTDGAADCNGQCHAGEALIFKSSWGGSPTEADQKKCNRGAKVFCCQAGDWSAITSSCYWTDCGKNCNSASETSVSTANKECLRSKKNYCCANPAPFKDCHWVGKSPDCANAKCASDEVTIDLSYYAEGGTDGCAWHRQMANCCKVVTAPTTPLKCSKSLCDLDATSLCSIGENGAFGSSGLARRDSNVTHNLEKRGGSRKFAVILKGLTDTIYILSRSYPSRGSLFSSQQAQLEVLQRYWHVNNNNANCDDVTVESEPVDTSNVPADGHVEHIVELQTVRDLVEGFTSSTLPDGTTARTTPIPATYIRDVLLSPNALPSGIPRVSDSSPIMTSPIDRMFEAVGSNTDRHNLILASGELNTAKGALTSLIGPTSSANFRLLANRAIIDTNAATAALQWIRTPIAVFEYHNDLDVVDRRRAILSSLRDQLVYTERNTIGGQGLVDFFDEWMPAYQRSRERFAQDWVQDRINDMREIFNQIGPTPINKLEVLEALRNLEGHIRDMRYP